MCQQLVRLTILLVKKQPNTAPLTIGRLSVHEASALVAAQEVQVVDSSRAYRSQICSKEHSSPIFNFPSIIIFLNFES
ncbi:hypothetical protein SFRURICE_014359 [Spodoptera frugiperda]|uniref:SFRICE_036625 n=1 Tax=Spodoptera frugiperda TaxID=7108 RepID=A0A2H1WJ04_SPOFR|nr:hypothetical protein SFRURICE_014359 [Spodoptera frugiperda]